MLRILGIAVGQVAGVAAVAGLLATLVPHPGAWKWWHWLLLVAFVGSSIFVVVLEVDQWWRSRPRRLREVSKIKRYMEQWISQGGLTVIMSRDLSWADEPRTKEILRNKAEKGELILCLQSDSEQTKYLREAGAKLWAYGTDFTPRSRFTIIDYGKDGARVAIGVKQKGVQVIEEYQAGSHPLYSVAEDLIHLIQKIAPPK